jgi:hypothetical protein
MIQFCESHELTSCFAFRSNRLERFMHFSRTGAISPCTQRSRRIVIDAGWIASQNDAVGFACLCRTHDAIGHIAQHSVRIAQQRIAEASATRRSNYDAKRVEVTHTVLRRFDGATID